MRARMRVVFIYEQNTSLKEGGRYFFLESTQNLHAQKHTSARNNTH